MSRAELAAQSRISLSSLEKALSGQRPFTQQIIIRIEEALQMRLRAAIDRNDQIAPEWLGSYARTAMRSIEGEYLTLRPASTAAESIYAYLTEIGWNDEQSCLTFRETERLDGEYAQFGSVSVPHQTGHIYLVTNKHGQYRLAVLSRPLIKGEMFGVLTTLQTGRGSQLLPVASPIALVPLADRAKQPILGRIDPGNQQHGAYAAILGRALSEDFARLLAPSTSPTRP